jgi:hypothetical protein
VLFLDDACLSLIGHYAGLRKLLEKPKFNENFIPSHFLNKGVQCLPVQRIVSLLDLEEKNNMSYHFL